MRRADSALLALVVLLATAPGDGIADRDPTPTPAPTATAALIPEAPPVTLRWTATREDSVYGYLVYRSALREGPFRRINPEIIHVPQGPSGAVNSYEYVDRDVVAGTTYYYYLDTVSTGGRKQRFSGVVSRTVTGDGDAR